MRRLVLVVLGLAAALVLVPTAAVADSATHTYTLEMDANAPNIGVAPNGDQIAITGEAEFSVNPKSVKGRGSFTHTNSGGDVLATGTWEATQLLDYQSYGCGVVFGDPSLPDNFCGGKVKMSVMLTTPLGELPGIMTVICVIGPNPPNSIDAGRGEGAMLSVPGVINFNHTAGGDNIIVQTS
jgi:hypothetical protein